MSSIIPKYHKRNISGRMISKYLVSCAYPSDIMSVHIAKINPCDWLPIDILKQHLIGQ